MTRKEAVIGSTLVVVSTVLARLAAEVAFGWVDGFGCGSRPCPGRTPATSWASPLIPDLFEDAIHMTQEGIRMHAWIVFQALASILEARIAGGTLPRPPRSPSARQHPAFQREPELVPVRESARACQSRSQ